jgi:hypothetical protein
MTAQQAYERGKHDAKRERAPIFRDTRMGIIPTVDDDMSDDWSHDDRFHYLQGYQEG